ncbi:hypothetical protein EK904_014421, partial [Melospiza melodia maxima]
IILSDFPGTLQRNNITSTGQGNFWEVAIRKDKQLFSSFLLSGFVYATSFLAVMFSAVFLLFSLWRHKRTMRTGSMKDLSMDAHIRAMKSVLSFLVMYSINFVCLVLTKIYGTKKENIMTLLLYIYLCAFPEILALAISIFTYVLSESLQMNNITSTGQENFWEVTIRKNKHLFSSHFLAGLVFAASFLVVTFSAVFLLFSLWRHKCTMQTSSMKDLSMDAHIRAMKSVLSFLVMYSINFVCLILKIIYATKQENIMKLLIYMYLFAFPGVHSLILIFSNPKLEKALLKILSCVKCEGFIKMKCLQ